MKKSSAKYLMRNRSGEGLKNQTNHREYRIFENGIDEKVGIMMGKAYCGKDCDVCEEKTLTKCDGCEDGPGSHFGGNCPIAVCCREKHHENCATCQRAERCGRLDDSERMPEIRRKAEENKQAQEAAKKTHAAVLGKWLWILFWLIIPSGIAGILGNENIVGNESGVYVVGLLLSMVVSIVYGVILLQLQDVEAKYRFAGMFSILSAILAIVLELIPMENPFLILLAGAPAVILGLVAKYYEFYGHAAVLMDFDSTFSQKWLTLWKWNCIIIAVLVVSVFLGMFMLLLTALLLLACSVGILVISIVQLVYLYKMAKLFREYA